MENFEKVEVNIEKVPELCKKPATRKPKRSVFEKFSFWVFLAFSFVIPFFIYSPFSGFFLDINKKALLFVTVLLALVFWLLARFEDGKFSFPGGLILGSYAILLVSILISAGLSRSPSQSFVGFGFEADTFVSVLAFLIIVFLSSIFFQSRHKLFYFYISLAVSAGIVFLAQTYQMVMGAKFISDMGNVSNLLGKWNDFGIFFGLVGLLALIGIELLKTEKIFRAILWMALVLSLVAVGIVNLGLLWGVVAVYSLVVYIFSLSFFGYFMQLDDAEKCKKPNPLKPSAVVLIIAVLMFMTNVKVSEIIASKFNIYSSEVRPSWSATLGINRATMDESYKNFSFGAGPNEFANQWSKFKPSGVNESAFWNTDFNVGVGRIPSFPATYGLLGTLAWLLFILLPVYFGVRAVFFSKLDLSVKSVIFTSLVSCMYLWTFSFLYFTGTVILAFSFISLGILVANLVKAGSIKNLEFSFLKDPRTGFASVLLLVILIISDVSVGYLLFQKFTAYKSFQTSLIIANNEGNFDKAEAGLLDAISRDSQDTYYRAISELYILKMKAILSEKIADQKEAVAKLQDILSKASASALKAKELDGANYLNLVAVGKVGEAVVPLKLVEGAYAFAKENYDGALKLSPNNPAVFMSLARLEIANGSSKTAKEFLNKALEAKTNYVEALYMLAQIEADLGNLKEAILKTEQATVFAPNDIGVWFQLGFLRYSNKDYDGAISALEKALSINDQYANAKYFLGLSYSKVGRKADALEIFKQIAETNPDNSEIKKLIEELSRLVPKATTKKK